MSTSGPASPESGPKSSESLENELAWMRERLEVLERAFFASRREILESHARLACIAKVVRDHPRCMRAPGASFGKIRVALFAEKPPGAIFD